MNEEECLKRERQRGERQSGQMVWNLFDHCEDCGFYTERNEELLKSYPKKSGGKAIEGF